MWTISHSLLVLATAVSGIVAQDVTNSSYLQFSWDQPPSALRLPQDLCGFSIESDRFPHWAGNVSQKNEFTYNLMNNLKQKTGVPPHIRVGGGSQDLVISTPSVTGNPGFYNVFSAVPAIPSNTKVLFPQAKFTAAGLNFWLSSGNFPSGTKFTWGVNFRAGNSSEAVAQVKQIEKAFADPHCRDVKLYNIELGNEADTWNDDDRRPKNYSVWNYKDEQVEYFKAITKALGKNKRNYRIADWALYWRSTDLLATGIMDSVMGSSVKTISEHHYQGSTDRTLAPPSDWPGMATDLIDKAFVRKNISSYTVSALDAQKAGIEFVLGETNSYFGHGQPGVSNSAASALWMIDYSLQAACNGVAGLHFHQGVGYNYSAFEPLDFIGKNITDFDPNARRHVMPLYYGYLAVADAIGRSSRSYVNEIWTDSKGLSAYQIWEGHQLKRIMLINSVPWTSVSKGNRPVTAVKLPGLVGLKGVTYKALEFSSISVLKGLTWGGQSWETRSGLPTGKETFQKVQSSGTINMNASSAVLIYI